MTLPYNYNVSEVAKELLTKHAIDPIVIHIDIAKIPLTEFMKALGQEHPVAADGDLRIYNSPYDLPSKGTMVINIRTNKWRDAKSGANGRIYDLAYELTGCANKSELNRYIAGEMDYFQKQQLETDKDEKSQSHKKMRLKDALRSGCIPLPYTIIVCHMGILFLFLVG